VWFIKKPVKNDLHPTCKPVELIERALHNSSKTRDTVLDPFAGSTLLACERAGRQARLIELDPHYCDVVIQRYAEFTGKHAHLEKDGRTFDEVGASREAAPA
jgi:DNA modification methylase